MIRISTLKKAIVQTDRDRELKRAEESKRDRCWDPAARWKVIQETITWAEAQTTVRRNTPRACLERQRKHQDMQQGG